MSEPRFFSTEEYEQRLTALRQEMAERGLDGCLVTTPENIYYLAGLSHQGFFAYHVLLVPRSGQLTLITRAMERITIEDCGKSRLPLNGFVTDLHQANLRKLFGQMARESALAG